MGNNGKKLASLLFPIQIRDAAVLSVYNNSTWWYCDVLAWLILGCESKERSNSACESQGKSGKQVQNSKSKSQRRSETRRNVTDISE